jgi:DNA-binding CsgD family transcriptional regulator
VYLAPWRPRLLCVSTEVTHTLVGRDHELHRLQGLLDSARAGRSASLLLVGEPGIGKSMLCQATIEMATDMTVLMTRGRETDAELAFAGLCELLGGLDDRLVELPPPQADALRAALALTPTTTTTDPLAVRLATLGLLAAAAESGPLLVVVDDACDLDEPSREAVLFAARRLHAEGVAVLVTTRGDAEGGGFAGLPVMRIGGLDRRSAHLLLAGATGRDLPVAVTDALCRDTGGNPLALVEIVGLLSARQLDGRAPIDDPLPAGPVIERAFRSRLAVLDAGERTALLVVATSVTGTVGVIAAALERLGVPRLAVERAETAGHVRIDGGTVEFRHPLLRLAVRHTASPAEQRRVHTALADASVGDPNSAVWYRAAATIGHDDEVATALVGVAADARARAAPATAAVALEKAAQLAVDRGTSARHLGDAAADWLLAGHAQRAAEAAAAGLERARCPKVRAHLQFVHGIVLAVAGRATEAHIALLEEARRRGSDDPGTAAYFYSGAVLASYLSGDVRRTLPIARHGYEVSQRAGGLPAAVAAAVLGQEELMRGDPTAGEALLDVALPQFLASDPVLGAHLQAMGATAIAFSWLERFDDVRAVLRRIVVEARRAGVPGTLAFPLIVLADTEWRAGAWDLALATALDAVTTARETAQHNHLPHALATLARVEAAFGREAEARRHLAEAARIATERGLSGGMGAYIDAALGFLELGVGRTADSTPPLQRVWHRIEATATREPAVILWAPDLIESLARIGHFDEAHRVLNQFRSHAERSGRRWALGGSARCEGLLAGGDAIDRFESARKLHHAAGMPFELARTRLCAGEALRRQRRRAAAREELHAALDGFDALGAEPWSARARAELEATGEKVRARPAPKAELTPQELQVAMLVASGTTNREAANALFISQKTVEYHLSAIYRKLQIRSRTELAYRFRDTTR